MDIPANVVHLVASSPHLHARKAQLDAMQLSGPEAAEEQAMLAPIAPEFRDPLFVIYQRQPFFVDLQGVICQYILPLEIHSTRHMHVYPVYLWADSMLR